MSLISVSTVQQGPQIPAGVTRAGTELTVEDSSGSPAQTLTLNGSETPTPWTAQFTVASGKGSVSAQDIDTNGNDIGTAVSSAFDTTAGQGGTPQLATSGVAVTVLTP